MAARTVIVRQGLEATTLRDIAREGGFTTGVVSHYFPDKTAVIVGTFTFAAEEWNILVQRTVTAAPTAGAGPRQPRPRVDPDRPGLPRGVAAVVGDVDVRRA